MGSSQSRCRTRSCFRGSGRWSWSCRQRSHVRRWRWRLLPRWLRLGRCYGRQSPLPLLFLRGGAEGGKLPSWWRAACSTGDSDLKRSTMSIFQIINSKSEERGKKYGWGWAGVWKGDSDLCRGTVLSPHTQVALYRVRPLVIPFMSIPNNPPIDWKAGVIKIPWVFQRFQHPPMFQHSLHGEAVKWDHCWIKKESLKQSWK